MWHWSLNRISCQDALCIKLRGGIFQLVYPFLTYKHPTIHEFQTSVCLTRDHAGTWLEKTKDSAIFGSTVRRHGEWRNKKTNLTAPGISSAPLLRPTYINLLLLLLCASSVYFYTCLCQYQSAEVHCETFNFICVSCMSLFVEERKINTTLPCQAFNPFFKKDCQRALFHLTHFMFFFIQTNFRVLVWISAGSFKLHGSKLDIYVSNCKTIWVFLRIFSGIGYQLFNRKKY